MLLECIYFCQHDGELVISVECLVSLTDVYACMYVCLYVSMYVCMYVCMHVCMNVCMHTCMHECMNVCMYVYVCMYEVYRVVGGMVLKARHRKPMEGVQIRHSDRFKTFCF